MLFQLPSSALLLSLIVLTEASSHGHGAHLANMRRHHAQPRAVVGNATLSRKSCQKKAESSSAASSTIANVASDPSTTSSAKATATNPSSGGVAVKPSDWPTATQAGPQPTSTVASASDPYLKELSKAIDNSGNSQFTSIHTGDMTYYGQGLGACGDVYDDNSFTAAVSHSMFDTWIGGSDTSAQNRNPICGPFVPGRQTLNMAGVFVSAVKSSIPGYAMVGGDGLINCVGSTDPIVQCHIPLTATVTHGDKSIQVKIVDRCAACAEGDIDLTPAAFAALADPGLGRTSVTWKFDKW